MRITFIGGGNMATAIVSAVLRQGMQQIHVVELDAEKRSYLAQTYGVSVGETAPTFSSSDVIILCVKPQVMREVCLSLATNGALVISIAAGINIDALSRWLGGALRIIRAMPNTPALVCKGVTGLFAAKSISDLDKTVAFDIMSASGVVHWLEKESQIDDITCISGSGPAYVFYFMESMIDSAISHGFKQQDARSLVLATFDGAVALARQQDNLEISKLRHNVTSVGGTTAQALASFEVNELKNKIAEGINACRKRAVELSNMLSDDN